MRKRTHRKILIYGSIIVFISLVLFLTAFSYTKKLYNMLQKENYEYLEDIAAQSSLAIEEKLKGDMRMMKAIAIMLGDMETLDVDHVVDMLGEQALFDQFQRIGIIFPDGRGYGQDVSGSDFSDRIYFQEAMQGEYYVSEVMVDKTSKKLSNTYALPIYHDDVIIGVLAAVTDMSAFQNSLFPTPFMGKGYTFMITKNGNPVVYSSNPDSNRSFSNFFNTINAGEETLEIMQSSMFEGKSGRLEYSSEGQDYFLSYVPLDVSDWYAISIVSADVVLTKSNRILSVTAVATAIACLSLFLCLMFIFLLQVQSKRKLARLAYNDELTGLMNKNGFRLGAETALLDVGNTYAYCLLDVKRFKIINERYGYEIGDYMLCHIAGILTESLADSEVAARFSSDAFHLLLHFKENAEMEQRLNALAQKMDVHDFIPDSYYHVHLGFGIYIVDDRGMSIDSMGDKAALALHSMRSQYKTTCCFYNDIAESDIREEQEMENGMKRALSQEEFHIYLQPQYSLETGHIKGVEVLARWIHPTKGLISPVKFIPLFEKNGFITEFDLYIFGKSCKTLASWKQYGNLPFRMSINQSRINLYTPGYIQKLSDYLSQYKIDPKYIEIEITESDFYNDLDAMIKISDLLHQIGFRVSMDDFGSGYSSLNMLQEIQLDELKIDKNFFKESTDTARGQKIVENIISLARDLNMETVAEGVETKEQVDFLKQAQCQCVQGFYFCKPLPVPDFEHMFF